MKSFKKLFIARLSAGADFCQQETKDLFPAP